MSASRSLRRLLLGWLSVPLVAVVVGASIVDYIFAVRAATEAYDRSLLDPALALEQSLRMVDGRTELVAPEVALELLRIDSADRTYFSVTMADGRALGGQPGIPPPPEALVPGVPVFYDGEFRGRPVRIAAIALDRPDGRLTIQAAETRVKRERLVRQILLTSAVPMIVFATAAALVVWFGIGKGLAPLDQLRAEVAARSHRDLRPVPEEHAPEEVRPLVHELNDLLGRLSRTIESQQRFIADAAHQLRTPLAALQAQVEAALRQPLTPPLAATLDSLRAGTRRTAHLARQLLALARVDPSAERPFAPERTDLAVLVASGVDEWVRRADDARIDLGFELEPAPLLAEPLLIGELAANLVDNALTYTQPEGVVTVRTGARHGRPFLEVEDNGPGIPEAERERVFERFHRVKGTGAPGTGLGLAIVREIADRHGAEVTLREPASDRGTIVTVEFPHVEESVAVGAVREDVRARARG